MYSIAIMKIVVTFTLDSGLIRLRVEMYFNQCICCLNLFRNSNAPDKLHTQKIMAGCLICSGIRFHLM